MKVLIVDDKKEALYMLETLLRGNGYEVVSASNGAEALERLRTEGADLIISDILMPVMDGIRFCMEVMEDEKLRDIIFIFYTATYTDEKDEELALAIGADRFIRKPTEPDELMELIKATIRDADKGKIIPETSVREEEGILKLYNERLINKLEKKMLDLEKEIAERKKAENDLKRRTHDLGERVKELHCLYNISKIVEEMGLS
ncbi:MAG: response regulator, partial [Deltaproteobacteria bacterium]|nr:response regulator [Deltaproteobacteria bacterium]